MMISKRYQTPTCLQQRLVFTIFSQKKASTSAMSAFGMSAKSLTGANLTCGLPRPTPQRAQRADLKVLKRGRCNRSVTAVKDVGPDIFFGRLPPQRPQSSLEPLPTNHPYQGPKQRIRIPLTKLSGSPRGKGMGLFSSLTAGCERDTDARARRGETRSGSSRKTRRTFRCLHASGGESASRKDGRVSVR